MELIIKKNIANGNLVLPILSFPNIYSAFMSHGECDQQKTDVHVMFLL